MDRSDILVDELAYLASQLGYGPEDREALVQAMERALERQRHPDEAVTQRIEPYSTMDSMELWGEELGHEPESTRPIDVTELEKDWAGLVGEESVWSFDGPPSRPASGAHQIGSLLDGEAEPAGRLTADRYVDRGFIGKGAVGEVRRVEDPDLHRLVAMKVLLEQPDNDEVWAHRRFITEAQITAQLQHPGVVPVHELGRLPDGRLYYTMRELAGRTLQNVLLDTHRGVIDDPNPDPAELRRLVSLFQRACEPVAYAHSRGVVHRDLKPANIFVGGFGEVMVVDWGLAKALDTPNVEPTRLTLSSLSPSQTGVGRVIGTPLFMPPEQAVGRLDLVGPGSDVYSLGAVLFALITGRPPVGGRELEAVLDDVAHARIRPLIGPWPVDDELRGIVHRCMALKPKDRFADAGELAAQVRTWLDGAQRRARALQLVSDALQQSPQVAELRAVAGDLRRQASERLGAVEPWRGEQAKADAWADEDRAEELEREAEALDLAIHETLLAALNEEPTLPSAHAALAHRSRSAHAAALAQGDAAAAGMAERTLRKHVNALPSTHPVRATATRWLRGEGSFSLFTRPNAAVTLHRYELRNRRLVAEGFRFLGQTPLREVTVPEGSYLAVLESPGRKTVRVPLLVERSRHTNAVPPRASRPTQIVLPLDSAVGAHECVVPAGWFRASGDPQAPTPGPRQDVWLDCFVIQAFPVTNRQYLEFLNDELEAGRSADELRELAPRERGAGAVAGGDIYARDADGRFVLGVDADGDKWDLDWPVSMVTWHGAKAYARWYSRCTGRHWDLPSELAWEKAARGVDGRLFPWGDHLDPSWACFNLSHAGRKLPSVVDSFPVDVSPYGARGMAGNMRDWCGDAWLPDCLPVDAQRGSIFGISFEEDPTIWRPVRGGSWANPSQSCRSATRNALAPHSRLSGLSFRLVRKVGGADDAS